MGTRFKASVTDAFIHIAVQGSCRRCLRLLCEGKERKTGCGLLVLKFVSVQVTKRRERGCAAAKLAASDVPTVFQFAASAKTGFSENSPRWQLVGSLLNLLRSHFPCASAQRDLRFFPFPFFSFVEPARKKKKLEPRWSDHPVSTNVTTDEITPLHSSLKSLLLFQIISPHDSVNVDPDRHWTILDNSQL